MSDSFTGSLGSWRHEPNCPSLTAAGGLGQCTCTPEQKQIKALKAEIERLNAELAAVRGALTRSVSLQSHYAGLLNDYDGGRRLQFSDAKAWLDRLNFLSTSEAKGT